MGLDNGIVLKGVTQEMLEYIPERWIWNYGNTKHYEVCYMRKWWGTRNEIVRFLEGKYTPDYEGNDGVWELSIEDLKTIKTYYEGWDEKSWNNSENSYWEWEENSIENSLETKRLDFELLIVLKQKFPELKAEFYDSY